MQNITHWPTLRLISVGLLLAALFLVAGCETESDDIPTGPQVTVDLMIEEGWQEMRDGNFAEALLIFQEAANADASNLESYLGLGYAFAKANEPISAQRNLSNVTSLGEVMLADEEIDSTYAHALFAESYAGRASVALGTQDYEDVLMYGDQAEAIWSEVDNPTHRWLPDFGLLDVHLLKAEAHYNLMQYGEALEIVDDLQDGVIADMMANNVITFVTDDIEVTLLQETSTTGVARLDLSDENLVIPVSVMKDGISFTITDYVVSGSRVFFQANPIPTAGDVYTIEYYYADDFGMFLVELREAIEALQ